MDNDLPDSRNRESEMDLLNRISRLQSELDNLREIYIQRYGSRKSEMDNRESPLHYPPSDIDSITTY